MALNYDFSESKTELFVKSLEKLSDESENSLNILNTKIDEFFKSSTSRKYLNEIGWLIHG